MSRLASLALALLVGLLFATVSAAQPGQAATGATPTFVITNGQPRYTVDGKVIDAHGGQIVEYGAAYYLYGDAYACGFQWTNRNSPFCGFNVYTSTDLSQWSGPTLLFQPDSYWQNLCMLQQLPDNGCFRPHTLFNAQTGLYVLWVDVPGGYRALTSPSPTGPFTVVTTPAIQGGGDETIFSDSNGQGYVVWAYQGQIYEQRLRADYLDVSGSLWQITGFPQVPPFYGAEAPSLFARAGVYYLVLSVPQCPYCFGTGSGYLTAPTAAGPWTYQGLLSDWSCDGQPGAVSQLGTVYLYQSDQWLQTTNEYAAHQFWGPLNFNGTQIQPVDCRVGSYPHLSYFPWYDNASAGFAADGLHIVNPASNGQVALGAVSLPGQMKSFSIQPGQEWVGHFRPGTIGGPVEIGSNVPVVASQRVEYQQSFNEAPAQTLDAASSDLWLSWYDRHSSPLFEADNVHVVNPSDSAAAVSVSIPGQPGCTPSATIPAGGETIFTCPTGFGGPVHIHASVPVLASQRVQYGQTFNEVNAQPAPRATTSYAPWFDHMSSTLFLADNVHVVDINGNLASDGVQVSIPGCPQPSLWPFSSFEWVYACPFGQGFGGPLVVSATVPLLVSERVQYAQSFNEAPAQPAARAGDALAMPWFDHASSSAFVADNLHVVAVSGTLSPGQVVVGIPGCTPSVWQASPAELVYECPFGQGFGGPVTVQASQPVLASQRVQYALSFNETAALR